MSKDREWKAGDWALLPVRITSVGHEGANVIYKPWSQRIHVHYAEDMLPLDPPGHGRHLDGDKLKLHVCTLANMAKAARSWAASPAEKADCAARASCLEELAEHITEQLDAQGKPAPDAEWTPPDKWWLIKGQRVEKTTDGAHLAGDKGTIDELERKECPWITWDGSNVRTYCHIAHLRPIPPEDNDHE